MTKDIVSIWLGISRSDEEIQEDIQNIIEQQFNDRVTKFLIRERGVALYIEAVGGQYKYEIQAASDSRAIIRRLPLEEENVFEYPRLKCDGNGSL